MQGVLEKTYRLSEACLPKSCAKRRNLLWGRCEVSPLDGGVGRRGLCRPLPLSRSTQRGTGNGDVTLVIVIVLKHRSFYVISDVNRIEI
jgi:hypothetical protein